MASIFPTGRRLLAVLAHPDDESFGPGGTLALYARRGVEVHLVCATRGELGGAPEELLAGHADVAALREHELKCAAKELGLSGVHLLGYRDSGMLGSPDNQHPRALAAAPLDKVAGQVAHLIRQIRPQVIITFDPMGGYRHPDHIAIHRATLEAFQAGGDPARYPGGPPAFHPDKLYYHTFDHRFLRLAVRVMRLFGRDPSHFGRNADIDLADIASQDFPTHARIDFREVAEVKSRAAACHASQAGPPASGITGWFLRLAGGGETFMRAYPPAPRNLRETDLFEGVPE
ncbi:MAG: PIG-L family deacetylase [Chloroflexi bacterium]|jgi:LmbE family N-acetylglucosaminyl deacetylase|nr:PIG-L family deacetylase [Chloroflexota bacterium]